MRRRVLFSAIALCVGYAGYAAWKFSMTRSSTIRLEAAGYDLTYTMAWGWGMDQAFSLSRFGSPLSGPSSNWIEIWKRPYNSGLSVYRSQNDGIYLFGSVYRVFRFDPSSGGLKESCDSTDAPAYTSLGARLSETRSSALWDLQDPGAMSLFNYIEAGKEGSISTSPPDSKYYANLKYLGKFGLLRAGGRGGDVVFSPANKTPEPRLSLNVHCG